MNPNAPYNDLFNAFSWALPQPQPQPSKVYFEGGETSQEHKFAIQAEDGMRGYYREGWDGFGFSLKEAMLFDTTLEAAEKIVELNVPGRDLTIVRVLVTTTSPKVRVVETETAPATTVYKIIRLSDKRPVGQDPHCDVGFNYTTEPPLEFSTASEAALRIAKRNEKYHGREFAILPATKLRDVKVERTEVSPAVTTRSR